MNTELLLSGLPLWWAAGPRELLYGPEKQVLVPAVRRLGEMRAVLYPAGEPGRAEDERALYYMYRALNQPEHRALFQEKGIRYDVTVLEPGSIGLEYIKTAGHYHPFKPGSGCTYPEVYEVLHGRACYLMQKPHNLQDPRQGLAQVIVVDAGPGDKVLIPPDFGHITINPGHDFLVMSNLVAAAFQSVYEPLVEMGGGGYFGLVSAAAGRGDAGETAGADRPGAGANFSSAAGAVPGSSAAGHADPQNGTAAGDVEHRGSAAGRAGSEETAAGPFFVANPRYAALPPLARVGPQEVPPFSLLKDISQYSAFVANPGHFEFLTNPRDFTREFEKYLQALL